MPLESVSPSRRKFLQGTTLLLAATAAGGLTMPAFADVLSASDGAGSQKVRFPSGNSFVVGNLYLPAEYSAGQRYPAVVIGGSLTSVKEQMGGIYAIELARRGFIALAIDYRHYGESGGEPRQFENPGAKAEDLSSAVTFLSGRQDVVANAVSLLGVCTSGGTVLYTAARDQRILALACVASHLSEPAVTNPMLYGGPEGVARRRAAGDAARAEYERTGKSATILSYHNADTSASHVAPMEYYMDQSRGGGVKAWTNAFAVMSWGPWLDFDPVSEAARVTKPALIVHTDNCALPDQARKVHALLQGPKTLHWTTGNHFDFYDGAEKVREAADVVTEHFRKHLA